MINTITLAGTKDSPIEKIKEPQIPSHTPSRSDEPEVIVKGLFQTLS